MGMFRDTDSQEIDIVKEMAEALGSTGARLEETLREVEDAREEMFLLLDRQNSARDRADLTDAAALNDYISRFNALVDKAEDARRWLLIQREAVGFRTHRDVDLHYPIPAKMKLVGS